MPEPREVPGRLALLLVHCAVIGLATLSRSNGGRPVLAAELGQWLADLAASAPGHARGRVVPVAAAWRPCGCVTAAAALGVSERQVGRYVASGQLDGRKIGGTWVLDEWQVMDLAAGRRREQNRAGAA